MRISNSGFPASFLRLVGGIVLAVLAAFPSNAALPDGTQTFSGYLISSNVGTSPDGFFRLRPSAGTLAADAFGSYIDDGGATTPVTDAYLQVEAIGGLGSFKITSMTIGEYAAGGNNAFSNVRVVGYLSGSPVAQTTPYNSPHTGSVEDPYSINYAPLSGVNIDSFRVYYTTSNGTSQTSFNLSAFTIDEATPPSASIVSATYDFSSGVLVVTGANFTATGGATNDIVANKFTVTGQGGSTYTLTDTPNVEISSAASFTLTLTGTDRTGVNLLLNKNGASSIGGTTYNLAGAAGFVATEAGTADLTGNGITVSNVPANVAPVIANLNGDSGSFTEGDSVLVIDTGSNAVVSDADSADFNSGNLTVAIVANRVSSEDILAIANQGTDAGEIGVSGANVTYGGVTIGSFAGGNGTNNLVVTLNASSTPTAVQALVRNLTYSNSNSASPSTSARTVRVTVNDGDGGTSSNADVAISVAAINDAPSASNLTQNKSATEGGSGVALDDIVVTDVDVGEIVTARLTLSNPAAGTLSTGTYGSATSTFNAGTGVWTVTGSVADVNAALAAVAFTPSANNEQNFTITTRVRDAADTGPADGTISVTVTPANDAPTASNLTQNKSATEGGSGVPLDDIVVTDVDAGDTITATFTMSSAAAGPLSTGTFGSATSTFNAGTGVWSVTGSVADVNAALAAVAFTPSANNDQNFTITTRIRDAANAGPADGTITVTVTAVNDAPFASNLTQSKSATEGGSAIALDDIVVTDVDVGDSVTATITLSDPAAGTLSTGTFGSATSTFNAGTGVWTVTGSVADVNAALAAVALTPSSNNDQSFTIATRIRDAANTGPADGTITVTVTAAADEPSASNLTQSKSATEGGSAVALDDIVVSDVDTGETITATLTLSDPAAGTLSTGTFGSATSTFNAGTGVWTVTGSVADVNAALAAVAFTPSANNEQDFTITTRIRDAAETGPTDGTISVTVTATNDAPTVVNSIPNQNGTEDTAFNFPFAADAFADIDAGASLTYSAQLAGGGSLPAWLTFDAATRTFSGTPANGDVGTISIDVIADDGAGCTVTDTFDITVAAVNDAPVLTAPATIAVGEDTAAALTGISMSDVDAGSGDMTTSFSVGSGTLSATSGSGVIVAGSGTGALTLTGTVANTNAFIAASNVSFTPAANSTAAVILTVSINDGGNTGSGGPLTDSETITLTVAAVNDAPIDIALSNNSVLQSGGANAVVGTLSTTDVDIGDTFTYTLVTGAGSNDNASFNISGASLRANNAAVLSTGSHSVRIRVADSGAAFYEEAFSIAVVDDIVPAVTGVTSSTADGLYKAGDVVAIVVNFSQAVTVTGTPQLTLETGDVDQIVNYASGSGTTSLIFNYTVQPGDESDDLDYVATTSLTLNGGTIRDATANDALLVLPAPGQADSLGANRALMIDGATLAPTLTSPASNGTDNATLALDFTLPETALPGSVKLTFAHTGGAADAEAPHVLTFATAFESAGGHTTNLDGADLAAHSDVASLSGGAALVDGAIYSVSLEYRDVAGNTAAAVTNADFTYDSSNSAPSAPVLAPASDSGSSNSDNITNVVTPTFTGSSDASVTVTILVDGGSTGTTTADNDGAWSYTLSTALADGMHVVTAQSSDGIGNVSAESSPLTLTIDTSAPTVTSASSASGVFGATFSFNVVASGSSASFAATGLPAGLSLDTATGAITGIPTQAGSSTVGLTATDMAGNSGSSSLDVSVAKANQSIDFSPIPAITVNSTVTLTATASSGLGVTFSVVSGDAAVTGDSLTVHGTDPVVVRATQAGDANYNGATVDQTVGSIVKIAQTITFAALTDRAANSAPFDLNATATSGLPVTFALVSGPASLSGATVTLTGASGPVTLRASQPGDSIYAAATDVTRSFTVTAAGPQIFFGAISGAPDPAPIMSANNGFQISAATAADTLAATISQDNSHGTLIGYLQGLSQGFVADFDLRGDGSFEASATIVSNQTPPAAPVLTFRGQVLGGVLSGTIVELGATFSANIDPPTGPTVNVAGYYAAAATNTVTGSTYSIVGTNGEVFVLIVTPEFVTSGTGAITSSGELAVMTDSAATLTGRIDAASAVISSTLTTSDNTIIDFSGVETATARTDRLINLSSRGRVSPGTPLIAGFVIGGTESKQVLLRAVGPGLADLGVAQTLANPKLHLFNRQGQVILENDNWTGAEISSAANRVGAFALSTGSGDAALLTTLAPGVYTMHALSGDGSSGVALVEIYDASVNPEAEYQRLINISSRSTVGTGENVLIGGFVVTGNAPKRVLIRGIGPTLVGQGVPTVVADPVLRVYDRTQTGIAYNNDWGTPVSVSMGQISATAAEIVEANARVGAFALPASSKDASVIITLDPGIYTVVLSDGTSAGGSALIEVYELP